MNIVFADESTVTLGDTDFTPLRSLGQYSGYANSTESEIIERASEADVVIANKAPITRTVLESLPKVKLVAVIATGYNNVDVPAAKQRGVCVCNVPGYAAETVPQHAFALILNLATRAYQYHADVLAGAWQRASSFTLLSYPTFELSGKTIGIIGFGAIGRGVAQLATAFGMEVLVYDPYAGTPEGAKTVELDDLLRRADVVTVHCPLTEATRNLIDEAALARMKSSALLINTARGGIVNEEALAEALHAGRLAGAGVDVLTEEPPSSGNVLLSARNVILTPHSAWSTVEARQRLVDRTAENIEAFGAGRPQNVVA